MNVLAPPDVGKEAWTACRRISDADRILFRDTLGTGEALSGSSSIMVRNTVAEMLTHHVTFELTACETADVRVRTTIGSHDWGAGWARRADGA